MKIYAPIPKEDKFLTVVASTCCPIPLSDEERADSQKPLNTDDYATLQQLVVNSLRKLRRGWKSVYGEQDFRRRRVLLLRLGHVLERRIESVLHKQRHKRTKTRRNKA